MFEFDFKESLHNETIKHYEEFCHLSKRLPLIYEDQQERMDWFSEEAMKEFSELYNEICANVLERYHTNLMYYLRENF